MPPVKLVTFQMRRGYHWVVARCSYRGYEIDVCRQQHVNTKNRAAVGIDVTYTWIVRHPHGMPAHLGGGCKTPAEADQQATNWVDAQFGKEQSHERY